MNKFPRCPDIIPLLISLTYFFLQTLHLSCLHYGQTISVSLFSFTHFTTPHCPLTQVLTQYFLRMFHGFPPCHLVTPHASLRSFSCPPHTLVPPFPSFQKIITISFHVFTFTFHLMHTL